MGLCYQTSRWLDRLWSEHVEISESARESLQQGVAKQGQQFAGFPADIHARLYLPRDPPPIEPAPGWAKTLHDLASELAEWHRLRSMCARNGFAAGIAAEVVLDQLIDHVPDAPSADLQAAPQAWSPTANSSHTDTYSASGDPTEPLTGSDGAARIRASLRGAVRAARDAVHKAEASLDGLATPLGLPGQSVVRSGGPAPFKDVLRTYACLSSSRRLRHIAELAGRLERIASGKVRSRVRPAVGEIHGVGLGGVADFGRLLPTELVALRRRALRSQLFARLLQHQALVYSMEGREPQARGPVVVLLDESSSMRDDGKDIWSKAVALALMSTATRQRRAWHLVAFNGDIIRELAIPPRQATISDIQSALDHACRGGTCFDKPVRRAIEIIETNPTMRQADCVVISDGEDDLSPEVVASASTLTKREGVSWFVVGVGQEAERSIQSLAPIATSLVRIRSTDDGDDLVAPVINLCRE
jgi:hypothetical protein